MQPLCPSFVCLFFSSDMVSIFIVYLSILSALFVNYFTPMRVCPCFMMFGSWLSELFFQHVLTKVIYFRFHEVNIRYKPISGFFRGSNPDSVFPRRSDPGKPHLDPGPLLYPNFVCFSCEKYHVKPGYYFFSSNRSISRRFHREISEWWDI